ncbi:MAG: S41 family peptidase [Anaerolineae bacterium]|nr:S41 family peptidase [Thermoflexales bacterium]MDW8406293.1 S41 family peptidase [Anaerolineae bacterium]
MHTHERTSISSILKTALLGLLGLTVGVLIFVAGLGLGVAISGGFEQNGTSIVEPLAPPAADTEQNRPSGVDTALMNDVLRRLRSQWYGDMPSSDKLTDGALRGMVASLGDPFTAYIEPRYAKILEEDASGTFEGIGATLRQISGGGVQIVRTFEGAPAQKGGVLPGDMIEAVNGTPVNGLSTYEVAALVRGPKGTTVTLTLRRADIPKPFDITVVRDRINIPLVTGKMVGNGQIAYVSLFDFSAQASAQLTNQLRELLKQNPKGLILDLRDNPGGLLSQALEVGDLFLKDGVFIIQRDSKGNEERKSTTNRGIAQDIPMVVLVNGASASAAEVLAGAIQDYERAKVIGEQTFGKGSVQLPQTLSNGGQLRITIQRWYTPKNRAIHEVGIKPDYAVPMSVEDEAKGRDPQLDAAVDYLLLGKEPAPTPFPTVSPRP